LLSTFENVDAIGWEIDDEIALERLRSMGASPIIDPAP